jgi:hypothetical protein
MGGIRTIDFGVLEYRNPGVLIEVLFFNTPILHYSRAESLKNFGKLNVTLLPVMVPKTLISASTRRMIRLAPCWIFDIAFE